MADLGVGFEEINIEELPVVLIPFTAPFLCVVVRRGSSLNPTLRLRSSRSKVLST